MSFIRGIGLFGLAVLLISLSACHTVEKGGNVASKVSDSEIPLVPYDGWENMTQEQKWSMQLVISVILSEARAEGKEGMTAVMNVINRRAGSNPAEFPRIVSQYKEFSCMNPYAISLKNMKLYNDLKSFDVSELSKDDEEFVAAVCSKLPHGLCIPNMYPTLYFQLSYA